MTKNDLLLPGDAAFDLPVSESSTAGTRVRPSEDVEESGILPSSHAADSVARANHEALRAHFAKGAKSLDLSDALRSVYIGGERDRTFEHLLNTSLKTIAAERTDKTPFEARGIVVIADSGAGKSELIRRGLARHPFLSPYGTNVPGCLSLSVTCVGSCTLKVLGELLLEASGYPLIGELRENRVWHLLRERLQMLGTLVVHIDEINNLFENLHIPEQQRSINNLKALVNNRDWPVTLILSGTPAAAKVLQADEQIKRRLLWMRLDPLRWPQDAKLLEELVSALCRRANIQPPALFASIAERLVHASRQQLGTAAEICAQSVERAASEQASTLVIDHFASTYALRTGCEPKQNPFVRLDYKATDPGAVLGLDAEEDEPTAKRRRRRRAASPRRGFS